MTLFNSRFKLSSSLSALLMGISAIAITPSQSHACACGCGVFDVGTNAMFPTTSGGMVFLEYNFLNQSQNRAQGGSSPAANNDDKEIKTSFYKIGGQYMFNRNWGAQIEVPYWSRHFETTDENTGNPVSFDHGALGDIRIKGIYAGLFDDMSTGLTFGFKLPTGDSSYVNFDPDTEIGSGSTDLLLGIYHMGKITDDNLWTWFIQLNLDQPILSKPNYLPGNEIDTAIGAYYGGWKFGDANKIAPILELITAVRGMDAGSDAAQDQDGSGASGYRRILVSPGFETDLGAFRVYADVQVPIYQYFNGNQLAAPIGYKVATMFNF